MPAFTFSFKYERKNAADIAAACRCAGEVKFAGDYSVVPAEHFDGKVGEVEGSHGFACGVALFISIEDRLIPMGDSFADESGLWRVLIAAHEGVDVALVPSGLLIGQDLLDGSLIFADTIGGILREDGSAGDRQATENCDELQSTH